MKKILLCCCAGMSTSMLVKKMHEAATIRNIECQIEAVSVNTFDDAIQEYDVCLLGPQVRYQLDELQKKADEYKGKNEKKYNLFVSTVFSLIGMKKYLLNFAFRLKIKLYSNDC